jgi:PAS domain S-box-containing protein
MRAGFSKENSPRLPHVMTSTPLRLLLVEDSDQDEALVVLNLRRGGFDPRVTRVETAAGFEEALSRDSWDLIIADYNLPSFSGFEALAIFNRAKLDLPFILVSGTVGEEVAVEAMRAGAQDYLLKDHLTRLAPAVIRELREANVRAKRRVAENALRDSELRYRTLVENSNDLITELDFEGRVFYASPNHRALTGYTREQLVGTRIFERVHPEDLPEVVKTLQARGGTVIYRYRHADSRWRWFESTGRIFRTTDGQERGVVITRDVTAARAAEEIRRGLEEQLRQAQKMEAIGTLAGGIAHDFNNILTGILGNLELAGLELGPDHTAHSFLRDALRASNRARELVAQILLFSRRRDQQRVVSSLDQVVKEALRLLRASLPATIEFRTEIAAECRRVLCDATQIHQVIMNLGTNAAHAMRERGGVFTVTLATAAPDPVLAAAHPQLAAGRAVRLSVRDTGHGMDATTRERIFEPFFTTKPAGEGTGLGLAVVHGIMQSHDGAIAVESVPGQGTEFHLYFPAVETGETETDGAPGSPPLGRGQRVLLIDDEASIVQIGERMLAKLGYRPTGLTSSAEALALYEKNSGAFDAIITDLTMPEITGVELAQRVFAQNPQLPVILSTGSMGSLEIDRARSAGVKFFIEKPFTIHSLAAQLSAALA